LSEDFLEPGSFPAGSMVAGYRIESRIGAGGMAVVFRARDERLGRTVALKVMAPGWAEDEGFRRRFIAESRAAARVDDPHVIPVYEAGAAGRMLFIAMRLVTGTDLRGVLRREGVLSPGRAMELLSPVASALDAAHAAGLVHRDVKPGNVLIDERPGRPDHVYLADFGLSKGASAGSSLTVAGNYLGTPSYSAPEQIQGHGVDGRADQYALACVAFELLTGQAPYVRDQSMAVLFAHLSEPPPSLAALRPGLPVTVDLVMGMAMAKRPEQRYASCRDFTDALRGAFGLLPYGSGGSPVLGRPHTGAREPGGLAPGPGATVSLDRPAVSTQVVAVGQDARSGPGRGDGGPDRHPRRRSLVIALAGVVLAAAVAVSLVLAMPSTRGASGAGATAAKTPARPSAILPAPSGSTNIESVAFESSTDTVAVGMFSGGVDLWDAATKDIINILHDPGAGAGGVASVAFGPGGTLAVADGASVYLWETAYQPATLTTVFRAPAGVSGQLLTSVAFGPDGTTLAARYSGGNVYLWDTATKKVTVTLTGSDDSAGVGSVAFGPDGTLAVGDASGDVFLWDTASQQTTALLTAPPGSQSVDSLAFGPGGTLAVGSTNGDVYLWDTTTKQRTATLPAPAGINDRTSVAFGPDGTTLAVGYHNGDVYLWDTETGKVTGILHDPDPGEDGVRSLAFGPGGTLADGDDNSDTFLWHVSS